MEPNAELYPWISAAALATGLGSAAEIAGLISGVLAAGGTASGVGQ